MRETRDEGPLGQLRRFVERLKEQPTSKETGSKAMAEEAVLLLSNSDQEPIQTFESGSPSEFDLSELNPGSVFRLEMASASKRTIAYLWFVTGVMDGKSAEVYRIDFGYGIGIDSFGPELRLGEGWKLDRSWVSKTRFKIGESKIALMNPDLKDDWIPPTKIDLITGGTKERVKKTSAVGSKATKLITRPALQNN